MKGLAAPVLAILVGGCATTLVEPGQAHVDQDPLMMAFSTRMDALEAQAKGGSQGAQIALSIVQAEGLRGVTPDIAAAEEWRERARASSGPTQITQYIPGLNGAPGRTAIIMVPGRGLSAAGIQQIDDCINVLKARSTATAAFFPDVSMYRDPEAVIAWEQAQDAAARTCGGDERYGLLSLLWDRGRPWGDRALPDCDAADARCRALSEKIVRLNGRDPAAEAHAAVARGDARLGAFNHIGPMPQGWNLPGVDCTRWTRDQIGKWHVNQDVVSPGDSEHTSASVAFVAAYNRAVVTDPAFPWPDVCAETLVDPLDDYPGAVRTWTQAARSGDPARLADVQAGQAVNARDALGLTALDWAMRRGDETMALALLDAGADPAIVDPQETPPLALALSQKKLVLARRLMDRGARMTGNPEVCDFGGLWGGPPDRSANNGCSWAGMLIRAEAFDLLDAQAAAGALEPPPARETSFEAMQPLGRPPASIDPLGELQAAFFAAVVANDQPVIDRLLPHVGHGAGGSGPVLDRLLEAGRTDLALRYVLGRGADAARSDAEAGVWRVAAEGGRIEALTFLWDYGGDLNLLPPARLESCSTAARAGDVEILLTCVKEAGDRRVRLHAAMRDGDETTFRMLLDQASDLKERGKATQLSAAADLGSAEMVRAILARDARPNGFYSTQATAVYDGPLKARVDAVMAENGYAANYKLGDLPAMRAAQRGEADMLRNLVDAGAPNLLGMLQSAGNLGNPPPGLDRGLFERERSIDNEGLPNRAVDRNFEAFKLLTAEAARVYGPQSLERAFASAAYSGYNDAMEVLIAAGLDLSKTENPQRIWFNWASSSTPCKPSSGRILVRERLRADYPPSRETRWPPLHTVAVGCVDARSAEVLVQEGGMAVNQLSPDGDTALDTALLYRREATAETLRRLGGLTAAEAAPGDHAARRAAARTEGDLDLAQTMDMDE